MTGTIEPASNLRRSFVYSLLASHGATFATINDGAVAMSLGRDLAAEIAIGRRMALCDLSPLPRTGFKGTGAVEWLQSQGLSIGADSNMAYRQAGGELAARLAPTEIFLIDGIAGSGALMSKLNAAWSWTDQKPRKLIGYPMPRADSHCWFRVTGECAPIMFSKICGVDLRPHKFPPLRIAQTSVAKLSAIVIRDDLGALPGFHLLTDSASAEYMWHCVIDAMAEFDGHGIGLAALRGLAG